MSGDSFLIKQEWHLTQATRNHVLVFSIDLIIYSICYRIIETNAKADPQCTWFVLIHITLFYLLIDAESHAPRVLLTSSG